MATCYNIVYNTSTSAFEKHGGSLSDDVGSIEHSCEYYVDTDSTNNPLLNLSADNAVISANNDLESTLETAEQQTSGTPSINTNVNGEELEMKVTITIVVKTPIITVKYTPPEKTKKTNVLQRN